MGAVKVFLSSICSFRSRFCAISQITTIEGLFGRLLYGLSKVLPACSLFRSASFTQTPLPLPRLLGRELHVIARPLVLRILSRDPRTGSKCRHHPGLWSDSSRKTQPLAYNRRCHKLLKFLSVSVPAVFVQSSSLCSLFFPLLYPARSSAPSLRSAYR